MRVGFLDLGGLNIKVGNLDVEDGKVRVYTLPLLALLDVLDVDMEDVQFIYRITDDSQLKGKRKEVLNYLKEVTFSILDVDYLVLMGSSLNVDLKTTLENRLFLSGYLCKVKPVMYTFDRKFIEPSPTREVMVSHKGGVKAIVESMYPDLPVTEMGTSSTAIISRKGKQEILKFGLFSSLYSMNLSFMLLGHPHLYKESTSLMIDLMEMLSHHDKELHELYEKTWNKLIKGIPSLSIVKGEAEERMVKEMFGDTYADDTVVTRDTVVVIHRKFLRELEDRIMNFVVDYATTDNLNSMEIVASGYGENLLEHSLRNVFDVIKLSSLLGEEMSIYATEIGAMIDFVKFKGKVIDVKNLKVDVLKQPF